MLKLHKLCNVCKQVDGGNKTLLKDIYDSKAFMPHSSVTLKDVWLKHKQKYGEQFTYEALLNHSKKHQFMNEKDYQSRELRQIARQAEKKALKQAVDSATVWDEVLNKGMESLQNGEMVLKAGDLLKAAKDKSDFEMKTKDQQIAIAEMMWHFASGEDQSNDRIKYERRTIVEGQTAEDFDLTAGTSEDSAAGQDGPGGIYYPPAWDAATPGTS